MEDAGCKKYYLDGLCRLLTLCVCRIQAENLGGRNSCLALISVLVPKAYKGPEFIEALRAVLTEQGTVSLECKVIGTYLRLNLT